MNLRRLHKGTTIALVLILVLGLFLRLWRLDFGQELPYLAHTDELTQYNPAIRMITTGDLNPHFFNYPSLTIYIDAAVLYAGYWVGRLFGAFESLEDLQPIRRAQMAVGVVGTPQMLLLGRATTAVVGTATIGLVFLLARCLVERAWAALLAALLLAISMPHIRLSHYMTVDVIATFFAVACVTTCTLTLARKDPRFLWLAAVCGGLAASGKYNYAVLAVPVGLVCFLDPTVGLDRKVVRLFGSGGLFVLAFLVTSPFVLLDVEQASEGIMREIRHYSTGHLGVTGSSFLWYLEYLWRANPSYLILGVPGLVVAVVQRKRAGIPLVLVVAIYYYVIGRQAVHFDRNVLPVLVLLVAAVGVMVDAIVGWIPGQVREWSVGPSRFQVQPVIVLVALLPLVPSLVALPPLLRPLGPSGKAQAQAWFDKAIETPEAHQYLLPEPPRTLKIVGEAYTVYLDPDVYRADYYDTITKVDHGLLGLKMLKYDIVMLGSGMYARFYENPDVYAEKVAAYDELLEGVPDQLLFEGPYDPLDFREAGGQVYVLFMTEKAREFLRIMEGVE